MIGKDERFPASLMGGQNQPVTPSTYANFNQISQKTQ
jgi:hypothetical protein